MIERCDMETQAGSHCQRHGSHLTPQALSLSLSHSRNGFLFSASFVAFAQL